MNQLVGLPTSILKLNRLERLYVDDNKLTALPIEIGHLKELRELSVSNNQLVGLPTHIQKLTKLKGLNLNYNRLTTLIPEIGDLKELRTLNVRQNQLSCLPSSILRLKKLEGLNVAGNRLTELGSAADLNDLAYNLNRLKVSGNPLTVDAIRIILESMNRQKKYTDIMGECRLISTKLLLNF